MHANEQRLPSATRDCVRARTSALEARLALSCVRRRCSTVVFFIWTMP